MAECQYFYLGVEAEARLRKTLFDPTGFTASERQIVLDKRAQIDRWLRAVDIAFAKHYLGSVASEIDSTDLDPLARERYKNIRAMLGVELRPVIENRNKIAHGQPIWQLKSGSDVKFKATSTRIDFGDHWDLRNLRDALEAIGDIALTLIVSLPTFERDFARLYARFRRAKGNLVANIDGLEYERFAQSLGPVGGWKSGASQKRPLGQVGAVLGDAAPEQN